MRWRLQLAEFDFEVTYKKGQMNQEADALSHLLTISESVRANQNDELFTLDSISLGHQPEAVDDIYITE